MRPELSSERETREILEDGEMVDALRRSGKGKTYSTEEIRKEIETSAVDLEMKEHPILFTGWKVRRILEWDFEKDGDMQTRRIPTTRNSYCTTSGLPWKALDWSKPIYKDDSYDEPMIKVAGPEGTYHRVWCRYKVGDRLWVRHTHWRGGGPTNDQVWDEFTRTTRWEDGREIENHDLALDENGNHIMLKKKSSIHFPRWASRITLEVTGVRVERVAEIRHKEIELRAEGVVLPPETLFPCINTGSKLTEIFKRLWDSINAKRGYGWDANPWVWCVSFRRIKDAS